MFSRLSAAAPLAAPLVLALTAGLSAPLASAQTTRDYDALLRAEKHAEAERLADAALAKAPTDAVALAGKVSAMLNGPNAVKRVDDAVKLAERCVEANPKTALCHNSLGGALGTKAISAGIMSAMGYAHRIRDAFKTAVELDPKFTDARFNLLQYYLQAPGIVGGGKGKARDLAEDTARVLPAAGALMRANLLLSDDKTAEAEAIALRTVVGDDPDLQDQQRSLIFAVGNQYAGTKRWADAARIYNEVMRRYPDSEWGPYGVGRTLHEQGRCSDAVPMYERSLSMKARAQAHFRLGQCLSTLGDKARASTQLTRALAMQPGLPKKLRDEAESLLKTL
ncbi:MAG TPA: tetratricopeptide repeat protein [Burkholderiaceae bacterium]|nr:tetratricopeptide repeat protein [Burkholderiaceae bacterium]